MPAVKVEQFVNVTLCLNLFQGGLSSRYHLLRRLAVFDFDDDARVLIGGCEHQVSITVARLVVGEAVAELPERKFFLGRRCDAEDRFQ